MSPEKIPTWINELCSFFPCMIQRVQGNGLEINWGKIAQALVIVAVIAASTSFVTVKVLEIKFAQLEVKFGELKTDIKDDITEMKGDIKDIKKNNSDFKEEVDEQFDDIANNFVKIENRLDKLEK